jgi:hypothetical protein
LDYGDGRKRKETKETKEKEKTRDEREKDMKEKNRRRREGDDSENRQDDARRAWHGSRASTTQDEHGMDLEHRRRKTSMAWI